MDRLVTCFKKAEVSLADLTAHYEKIKAYYLEINYVLMSYDRQYYKETLEKINTNIFELRKKAEPKKKFKFSRRNEDFGVQEVKIVKEVVSAERKDSAIPGIENKNDQVLTVTSECPKGGSFKIISC